MFELGDQRKPAGTSSIVDESSFNRNFSELFTEGSLKYMNWEGVFAAGGSVMACLQPLPPKHDISNIARRRSGNVTCYLSDNFTFNKSACNVCL